MSTNNEGTNSNPVKLTFGQLRHANIERQKEWDGDAEFSELFFSNALGGETGEMAEVILALQVQVAVGKAQNIVKKLERFALGLRGSVSDRHSLGKELADVVFYADLLANRAGLDLASCVVNKYNEVSDKYGMHSHITINGTYYYVETEEDHGDPERLAVETRENQKP